jgi:hypothetical protein
VGSPRTPKGPKDASGIFRVAVARTLLSLAGKANPSLSAIYRMVHGSANKNDPLLAGRFYMLLMMDSNGYALEWAYPALGFLSCA